MEHTPPVSTLDAAKIAQWAQACSESLHSHKAEINSLNVFPVPDSDTGSNMAYTMQAAVESMYGAVGTADLKAVDWDGFSPAAVARSLAVGAARGARGNSGVVLAQLLRGLAETAQTQPLDGAAIAETLREAYNFVRSAIADPVEGTVITVLRSAATAAENTCKELSGATLSQVDVDPVVEASYLAALRALERTPSQLPVLRDSGVVDAGGRGLVVLLEVLHHQLCGCASSPLSAVEKSLPQQSARLENRPSSEISANDDDRQPLPALEVMYCIEGADLAEHREFLGQLGDSIVIGSIGDHEARVHVHTRDAGAVIEGALSRGSISNIHIEALVENTHQPARTGVAGAEGAAPSVELSNASIMGMKPKYRPLRRMRVVLALAPNDEVAQYFGRAGADSVVIKHSLTVDDDDSDAISAIVNKIAELRVSEVVLLSNGLIPRDTARVIADQCTDQCTVIPVAATTCAAGIAAMAVHDPAQSLIDDSSSMAQAAQETTTLEVSDSEVIIVEPHGSWGATRQPWPTMVSDPQPVDHEPTGLAHVAYVAERASSAIATTADSGAELVTVLAANAQLSEALGSRLAEHDLGIEVTISAVNCTQQGDPALYYLIGVE